jgi:hypothetical protein
MGILSSSTAVKLNKTAGTLNFSGALAITSNAGGSQVGGNTYDLFDASAFSGSFSSVTTLGSGSNWYTGNLTVDGTVLLNRWPVPVNTSITRASGLEAKVLKTALSATDPDGHTVTVQDIDTTTTNGAAITSDATYYYIPASTVTDAFRYKARDNFNGTNTGTILLTVATVFGENSGNVTVGVNTATAVLSGIPGYNYIVQRGTNVGFTGTVSNWPVAAAAGDGSITVIDDFNDLFGAPNIGTPASAFYRLQYVP